MNRVNLFEISSSDSEIERLNAKLQSGNDSSSKKLFDSLIETRKQENLENEEYEDFSSETSEEKEIKTIKSKNESFLSSAPSIDGSIYTEESTSFPKIFIN